MNTNHGIFTISLDFELYWGMLDVMAINDYKNNLDGVEKAVIGILDVFKKYDISATWATVGFLFASNLTELRKFYPAKQPGYINQKLSPYHYINTINGLVQPYHFAPDLIELIKSKKLQEIASHTFSHYYCLENGQTIDEFRADIQSAVAIANTKNTELKSIVFPRNQWAKEYLSVLSEFGISCFRGNEHSWLYKPVGKKDSSLLRRLVRFIDVYLNISGFNCYDLKDLSTSKPHNIPSSRLLRPVRRRLAVLESLRINRIKHAVKYAAEHNKLFHLWWHPHNFGVNTQENLAFLEEILIYFKEMNKLYGMQSMNMGAVSHLLDSVNEYEKSSQLKIVK